MSDRLEIVSGVPLRPIDRSPKKAPSKYPLEVMKVGDWCFVASVTVKSVSSYISRMARTITGTFSSRRDWAKKNPEGSWRQCDPNEPGAVEGVGIWRLK